MKSVVLVADYAVPRLGVQKALDEMLRLISGDYAIQVVTISGPRGQLWAPEVDSIELGFDYGFRGRVAALKSLRNLAKERRPTTFVLVGIWAAVTFLAATLGVSGVRTILWEHSVLPQRVRTDRKVALAALILRLLSPRLRHVVAVSSASARTARILVWPFADVSVVSNVVSSTGAGKRSGLENPLIERRLGDILLVGVGSLTPGKNWILAVRALTLLPSRFRMVIAGEGSERQGLLEEAARLGVANRFELLGYVDEVKTLVEESDAIVHPSISETFGYTILEAAVARRPVVVIDRPVMNEIVPRFAPGVISNDATIGGFAAAIEKAVSTEFDFETGDLARSNLMSPARIHRAWVSVLDSESI